MKCLKPRSKYHIWKKESYRKQCCNLLTLSMCYHLRCEVMVVADKAGWLQNNK